MYYTIEALLILTHLHSSRLLQQSNQRIHPSTNECVHVYVQINMRKKRGRKGGREGGSGGGREGGREGLMDEGREGGGGRE